MSNLVQRVKQECMLIYDGEKPQHYSQNITSDERKVLRQCCPLKKNLSFWESLTLHPTLYLFVDNRKEFDARFGTSTVHGIHYPLRRRKVLKQAKVLERRDRLYEEERMDREAYGPPSLFFHDTTPQEFTLTFFERFEGKPACIQFYQKGFRTYIVGPQELTTPFVRGCMKGDVDTTDFLLSFKTKGGEHILNVDAIEEVHLFDFLGERFHRHYNNKR